MGTMRMGWVVSTLGLAVALAPAEARSQSADPVRAAQIEAEAERLHERPGSWADAASLYLAAAALRQHEDPQARQDLFLAANLQYQLGDLPAAVAALESAGTRALSGGDSVFATQMFANAAVIADEAGLGDHERRLRSRVADLAGAAARQRGRS